MASKTLREAIARIRSSFKLQTLESAISDRAIAAELKSSALRFIKQATDKSKLWQSPNIFTTFGCLQMQEVPLGECCSYSTSCTISRSVLPIPRIAEGSNYGMLVQGVYSIDGISRKFKESSPDRFANTLDMGLKTKEIHFWIGGKGDKFYLYTSEPSLKMVKFIAYPEEDVDIALYNCEVDEQICPSNPYDQNFRCPGYMEDDVIKDVETKLLQTYKRSVEDGTDNDKDDTK